MSARVTGGTYSGGVTVDVECPALVQAEDGMTYELCQAELECERSAGGLWTMPTTCPACDRLIIGTLLGRRVIELGDEAIDNYDPTPNEQWEVTSGVSEGERQELAARDYLRLKP